MMMEILAENDKANEDRTRQQTTWGVIWTYLVFALIALLPVGLLGVIFIVVATEPSLLGLIAMFTTIILLH